MKSISEVLTKPTRMPVAGCEESGGMMTTPLPPQPLALSHTQAKPVENQNTSECSKPQPEDMLLSQNSEDRKKLTRLVTMCFQSLKTYGKEPEQLESLVALFQMKLARFPYRKVRFGFDEYLETGEEMPTPASIIKIIDPPEPERVWCATAFIDIKRRKREGQYITLREEQYCEDFLMQRTTAPEQQRDMIDSVVRNVAIEDKRYWVEG